MLFTSFDTFLLRAPIAPVRDAQRVNGIWQDVLQHDSGAWRDPILREAILVSSPSLARRLEGIANGQPASGRKLGKAGRALARYQLRMATRPTPFGLMAGVAMGRFGDAPSAELGAHPEKRTHPDREWLRAVLRRRARETALHERGHVRLLVNNTCFVQGGRVVVPVARPATPAVGEAAQGATRRTVRKTAAVAAVLTEADRPVAAEELHQRLLTRFPTADGGRMWDLLEKLVESDVLMADSWPPLSEKDPLRYALGRDPSWSAGAEYLEFFERYRSCPVGEGQAALSALYSATGSDASVHVDLALDADVCLPRRVAREVERAASVLWRLTEKNSGTERAMRSYHEEFLEHYSQGELVPVTRVLDPDAGLGAPAGYLGPPGYRGDVPSPVSGDSERGAILTRLAMEAVASGSRHIDLDEDLIDRLAQDAGEPPRSAELLVSVSATSLRAVEEGEFHVVVQGGSSQAGAAWGRFAHLLDAEDTLKDISGARDVDEDRPLPVQLLYAPHDDRGANIATGPLLTEHRLAVGVYDDFDAPGRIRLDDVLVAADPRGFHLYDGASGRKIEPFVTHLLDRKFGPNAARFLREAPTMGSAISPWSWGPMEGAPFLPGVRYGRVVLSVARWRLSSTDLPPGGDGERALDAWCRRWDVPDRIRLVQTGVYMSLDLRQAGHRAMLRAEVTRNGACTLYEAPESGWLRGPGGVHEAEIVVPLRATTTPSRAPDENPTDQPRQSGRRARPRSDALAHRHAPGGSWLSVHLHSSDVTQREILRHHLRAWIQDVEQWTDRWFFIRYTDVSTGRPHLRVRLHGDPSVLGRHVLDSVHTWSRDLIGARLLNDVSLHTYRAEVERYGGPSAIAAAEDFFCADSRLVLDRIEQGMDGALDVASDLISLARVFHTALQEEWENWFLRVFPKNEDLHQVFVRSRRAALDRVDADAAPRRPGQADFEWSQRLADYAAVVCGKAPPSTLPSPSGILGSLLHMHCIRRLGPDRNAERTAQAIARGVVEARVSRRRGRVVRPDAMPAPPFRSPAAATSLLGEDGAGR
ncbi:lantibiotic dehydratase [Streptomyces hygroscopicus subsp. jinggangensis 5008]|nr:lantibiotic dehydratase [Streptomyces hygroscopicus subsp. jinggangensis 5008]